MEDLFKKVLYTGVGLVSVTAEKLQQAVDKLVAENKLSSEEGRKVVDDLLKETEGKREEFESQLKKIVEGVFDRVKVVSQKDFDALLKRVEALEGVESSEEESEEGESGVPAPKRKTAPKKKEVVAE
jgi:polyhydroxyalkanoate synthesis regulator phasin